MARRALAALGALVLAGCVAGNANITVGSDVAKGSGGARRGGESAPPRRATPTPAASPTATPFVFVPATSGPPPATSAPTGTTPDATPTPAPALTGVLRLPRSLAARVVAGAGAVTVTPATTAPSASARPWRLLAESDPTVVVPGVRVELLKVGGEPLVDTGGQPITARTDPDGRYAFAGPLPAEPLVLRVALGEEGEVLGLVPAAKEARPPVDLDIASTWTCGYVLERFLRNQPKPAEAFARLPVDLLPKLEIAVGKALSALSGRDPTFTRAAALTAIAGLDGSGVPTPPPPEGETPEQYVTRLYLEELGRKPDPEGFKFWVGELGKTYTRDQMRVAFAGSPEAGQPATRIRRAWLLGQAAANGKDPVPTIPEDARHATAEVDVTTPEKLVESAAAWAAKTFPELAVAPRGGDEAARKARFTLVGHVIGVLRARDEDAQRLAQFSSKERNDPARYVEDVVVLSDARVFRVYDEGGKAALTPLEILSPKTDRNTGVVPATGEERPSTLNE